MLEPQKNIPIPKAARPNAKPRRKYPLDTMDINEMVFVEGLTKNTLATHISTQAKLLGRKFATRLCYMRKVDDAWVPCGKDDEGSTIGVGIWRTA